MNSIDLRGMQPGDLVEYQRLSYSLRAHGTFQRWLSTDDGQVRLVVRQQQWGMDLLVAPTRVISITRPSESQP